MCTAAGIRVKVIRFDVKDVSDWVAAGHTREELDALVAATPIWAPEPGQPSTEDGGLLTQPLTDAGNAERLIRLYGADIRFSADDKGEALGWLVWASGWWRPGSRDEVIPHALD